MLLASRLGKLAALTLTLGLCGFAAPAFAASPPAGVTGIALAGKVDLAWQPSAGAGSYAVYRGTSPTAVTTRVSPIGGVLATTFTDTTVANGTTYYYSVRAVEGGLESGDSKLASALPAARSCSTGNPVVLENCYPGTSAWKTLNVSRPPTGIEGYASAQSIDHGGSVNLKINTGAATTANIEIYRMGDYGGLGARLFSVMRGIPVGPQPACLTDSNTGMVDCGNWSTTTTLSTTANWPSGMYLLRIVRTDNNADNHILLTVRDDSRHPQLVFGSGYSTFEAYNPYGGKSLYTWNSVGANTVSGATRAVKVSFDRPFDQTQVRQHDWFTDVEQPTVGFLEHQGYDVGYIADTDLERHPEFASQGNAYFSPPHDEYISSGMRSALTAARDAGDGIFFSGANAVFWRVRFENGPQNGGQDRLLVCYKTTESGAADPVTPTTTWRDPSGANNPENALIGQQYIGQNTSVFYPLKVTGTQAQDRLFRYTSLDGMATGSTATLGSHIIGWEWDGRVSNGFEPAGVKTLAASPASGDILQDAGRVYAPGNALSNVTKYKAASGALVFATGTNQWWRGLANNIYNDGEPNSDIQQITANALADMNVVATTPRGITVDGPIDPAKVPGGVNAVAVGTDSVAISWNPVAGASGYTVYRSLSPRDGGYPLAQRASGSLVTGTSFTDTGLASSTPYYYVVTATVSGVQSGPSDEKSATTPAAPTAPIRINVGGPAYTSFSGAAWSADKNFSGGSTDSTSHAITGTTDPAIYQDERWGNFTYAIPVPTGTYDVRLHFAETYWGTVVAGGVGSRKFGFDVGDTATNPDIPIFDIFAAVGGNAALVKTVPDVHVTDGTLNLATVRGPADDPELTGIEVIPEPIGLPPVVTARNPGDGATGATSLVQPTATFSRDMDPSTLTAATFTLERASDGAPVAATVSYDAASRTATLKPSSALAWSTTYRARVTTGAKADDGTALTAASVWTFTTGTAPAPPTITTRTPAAGATAVAIKVKPAVTFSRDMDASSITASTFDLRAADATLVPATVSYDSASRTATLTPTSSLAYSSSYTLELAASVRSLDNVPLGTFTSWSFATTDPPPPDTQAPTVSLTAPAGGSTLIGTTRLTATASDNVGVASVQFKLDGANLGPQLTATPYQYDWATFGNVANGAHVLTAVAKDDAGNATTATSVNVNVNNPAVDPTGLVGAWGFEEPSGTGVTDSSPAHNDGTITGATRAASGKYGSALTFNGTNSWVTIPSSSTLDPGSALTLEAWVDPTALSDWRTVMLRERTTNAMSYSLYANNDINRASGHVSTNGTEVHTSGTAQVPLNTWTHLASTYDGSTLKLYVNGTLVSSRAVTGSVDTSTLPLRIGGNNVWGEFFQGMIDEVRVYRRALSAAEINTDMANAVKPAVPDNVPPTVALTAPAGGATVSGTTSVTASASDDRGVASVQFKLDGSNLGSADTSAPFSVNWNTTAAGNGSHTLTAVATDVGGNTTTSAAVTVTVDNGAPPTVSVTAPADGATVTGSTSLTATAADDRGVTSVQFKVDGTNVGSADTTSPYSVTWDSTTVANGSHTVTAVATDTDGNTTTATAHTITTSNTVAAPSGLVAAYGFDEGTGTTVRDSSGNGLNGTITGATWLTPGKFGSALNFNGSNSWVTVADGAPLHLTTGVTIEVWAKPSVVTGWRTAVLKEQSNGLSYAIYANTDTNRPSGHVNTGSESDTRGTATLSTTAWTHLAMTYDGTTLRFFVNGAQVSSKAVSGSIVTGTQSLRIGGNGVWGEYFSGGLDEVRVYNRALSLLEIQGDMSRPIGS